MQIDNTEALKVWLTSYLEPLCDADPAALSKYVIALIKKEKPLEDLRSSMEDQMEVFLQKSTKTFIKDLFNTLESKEYLDPPKTPKVEAEVADNKIDTETQVVADSTTPVRVSPDRDEERIARSGERFRRTEGYERRRGRSTPHGGGNSRRYRRSPPPRGAPGRTYRHSRSRSRSRSPYSRRRNRGSPFRGLSRSFSPPAYRKRPASPRGATPTKDEDNPYLAKRPRCRDYDEKGFCMQGDQCKFDHGNDAVVLEDGQQGVPAYQPTSVNPSATNYAEPYVPTPSSGVPLPPLHLPPPGYANPPAAIAGVKRAFEEESCTYPLHKVSAFSRLGGRSGFRGGRGRGARGGRGGAKQLAVRNIPTNLNNIAHLNNHFARFGTLVNVQVQFEGDPASALVTFSSAAETEMAFSSSEAVLGNRFIKMFYHYDKPKHPFNVKDRLGDDQEKVKYEGDVLTKTIDNSSSKTEEEKEAENQQKADEKAAAIAAIQKNQEILEAKSKLKKEAEEKRKAKMQKAVEIHKNKQIILGKLIEEQKKLIARIEEKPEEKLKVMPLLKEVIKSVDKTRKELKEALETSQVKKKPSEIQKQLLDAELELFQAQQDRSEDTEAIQKKVNQLRFEAARSGVLPTSRPPRGTGRGGFARGRGGRGGVFYSRGFRGGIRGRRSAYGGQTTLDRRPATIVVTGYETEEKEETIEHFKKFGEVIESIEDEGAHSIAFTFKTRREAEIAMNGGKALGEKMLNLSWGTMPSVSPGLSTLNTSDSSNTRDSIGEGVGEGANLEEHDLEHDDDYTPLDPHYLPPGLDEETVEKDEEALLEATSEEVNDLLYNDDEEEDSERSWKR